MGNWIVRLLVYWSIQKGDAVRSSANLAAHKLAKHSHGNKLCKTGPVFHLNTYSVNVLAAKCVGIYSAQKNYHTAQKR
jgi:hypothetical protein